MQHSNEVRRLGRRAPKRAPALLASAFLTGDIPAYPASADHFARISKWILGGNDQYGTCGPTSVANQRVLTSLYLTGTSEYATLDQVFDLYRRAGNPTFDPTDPGGPGDGGVDMQTMLEAVHADGIGGTKCVAFAKLNHNNSGEMDAAIATFGSVLLGVNLEQAQDTQTDSGTWDYVPSPEWGGHAVVAGRYSQLRNGVVTWAEVIDMTGMFVDHQVDEAWAVIWPEHLGSTEFQDGVDLFALSVAYRQLTGRELPIPVPVPAPPPVPVPVPADDADLALASVLRPWVGLHHVSGNARVARAGRAWLRAKGLL